MLILKRINNLARKNTAKYGRIRNPRATSMDDPGASGRQQFGTLGTGHFFGLFFFAASDSAFFNRFLRCS